MKNLRKIFFITICIILLSGFVFNKSIAITEALKEELKFKPVEEGDEVVYDVIIDGTKLLQTLKLPLISGELENILYGHNDLMDIKLLSGNSENEEENGAEAPEDTETDGENNADGGEAQFGLNIKNLTQSAFKATYYLSIGAMLVLILYAAFLVVGSTLKTGEEDVQGGKQKKHGKLLRKTVLKNLKDKLFIQEWIVGVIILSVLPFVINLTIYLSDYIMFSSPISVESNEKLDEGDIVVFVKGGTFPTSENGLSSNVVGNTSNMTTFPQYMFIGDSRVDEMASNALDAKVIYSSGNTFIRQFGSEVFVGGYSQGYGWLKATGVPKAEEQMGSINTNGLNVIIWLGTNDPYTDTATKYASYLNSLEEKWKSKGITLTYANIGISKKSMITDGMKTNERYKDFNSIMKNNLNSTIRYVDDYSFLEQMVSSEGEGAVLRNSAHYTNAAYKKLYNFFKGYNSSEYVTSGNAVRVGKPIGDFCFTTSIEGLLAVLTYYQGLDTLALIASFLVTICKVTLLVIFLLRVYVLGIVIAISPILVIIDTFRKINRRYGFMKRWVTIFLYLVFIRPVVYAVYYLFIKSRPLDASAEPVWLILFSLVAIILCIFSAVKVFRYMFKKVTTR